MAIFFLALLRKYWKFALLIVGIMLLSGGVYWNLNPAKSLSLVRIIYPKGQSIAEFYLLQSEKLLKETLQNQSDLCVRAFEKGSLGRKREVYGAQFPFLIQYKKLPQEWLNTELIFSITSEGTYSLTQKDGKSREGKFGLIQTLKPGLLLIAREGNSRKTLQNQTFTVILESPNEAAQRWEKRQNVDFGTKQSRQIKLSFSDKFPNRGEKMLRSFMDVYMREQQAKQQDSLLRSLETVNWMIQKWELEYQREGGLPPFMNQQHSFRKVQEKSVNDLKENEIRLEKTKAKINILIRMQEGILGEKQSAEWATLVDTPEDSIVLATISEWEKTSTNPNWIENYGERKFQAIRKNRDISIKKRIIELEQEKIFFKNELAVSQNWMMDFSNSEATLWELTTPEDRMKALAWNKYILQLKEKIRLEEKISHYSPHFRLVYDSGSEARIPLSTFLQYCFLIAIGILSLLFLGVTFFQFLREKNAMPEELFFRTGFPVFQEINAPFSDPSALLPLKANLEIKALPERGVITFVGESGETFPKEMLTQLNTLFEAAGKSVRTIFLEEETTLSKVKEQQKVHELLVVLADNDGKHPDFWQTLNHSHRVIWVYQECQSSKSCLLKFAKQAKSFSWKHVEMIFVYE